MHDSILTFLKQINIIRFVFSNCLVIYFVYFFCFIFVKGKRIEHDAFHNPMHGMLNVRSNFSIPTVTKWKNINKYGFVHRVGNYNYQKNGNINIFRRSNSYAINYRFKVNPFKSKKNKDIYFLGMHTNRNEKLNETKCGGGCGTCSSQVNTNCSETNDDEKNNDKILYLINPRGFCKGVSRAIETVEECLKTFKTNIYVKHKIVHNDIVCKDLESKGAIFIEDLNEVPDGSILIYSAHGISPQIRELAKKKKLIEIDATCPLVNKVHVYVKLKAKEGYKIILIGYKNHVEVVGTYNEAPDSTYIVENVEQVNNLDFPENQKLFLVTQTTLSIDDCSLIVNKLKEKYPHIETIPSGSICYATTNRQKALTKICTECDLTIVVGSQSSSNAKKLVYSSQIRNTDAILVNTVNDFDFSSLKNVKKIALTSAASTPDELTQQFVTVLTSSPYNYKLSIFDGVEETVPKWKLPKELINMIKQKNEKES
ncbi:4-hydroxy-3-methylbut-2-enyl diphosphate reductase, putative [Plasmodium chabaudi adami]|uniref:4-hydroxy-3-methylbut-2-enyl diphosphate reductase n=1 Tax=Plasmodium chabaudi adami TaxID=5826 RepID=A0A1D3LEB6_PLACE|nr:4-hydroxy-3-methylbut-2-enyl diphosphate reductase, putative [Plasmodium chabaudi adami]